MLEDKLVQDNWVSPQQLTIAKEEAAASKRSVWAALAKLGFMSAEDIAIFFAQESGVPYVKISDYKIDPGVLRLIDEDFCRQHLLIPLFKIKDALFVACGNPLNAELMDTLAKSLSGCSIEPLLAPAYSIIKALDSFYGLEDKVFELEKFIVKPSPLTGLSFWRESERLPLNIPVSVRIEDASLVLPYSSSIDGYSHNISRNGAALGLEVFLFLPRGIKLSLEFKPGPGMLAADEVIKAKGEVVYCRMEKGQRYFLGVRFIELTEEARTQLFKSAGSK